jgi:ribonuclease VapC
VIVDPSAVIAILADESEGPECRTLIMSDPDPKMSAASLTELRMVCIRRGAEEDLEKLLAVLALRIVPLDEDQALQAAEAFRRFGKGRHAAGLNFGDLFAYALARALREPLLFVGGDFARTDVKPARV